MKRKQQVKRLLSGLLAAGMCVGMATPAAYAEEALPAAAEQEGELPDNTVELPAETPAEQPAEEKPTEEQPVEEQPAEEQPIEEKPAEELPPVESFDGKTETEASGEDVSDIMDEIFPEDRF